MGLWDGVKRQLRSVIEWNDPATETLFELWSENGEEIKNASQLIVGPGQGCIFVYQGRVQGHYENEGMYELATDNIPFWTNVTKFMQAFESEHKVSIFFYRKTKFLDQKWGTPTPIRYEDPKYKFPVGLRAFGNYSFRITEPKSFFTEILGGSHFYSAEDFRKVMKGRLIQPLSDYMAECKFSYAEIDANREELSQELEAKISPDFTKLGFAIHDFRIEGTNFDDDTQARISRIANMTAEAQAAAAVGLNYAQLKQLEALQAAAENEGGAAGVGMGLGAGMGFGNMMAGAMAPSNMGQSFLQSSQNEDSSNSMAKLKQLKEMFEMELINESEYQAKKQEILSSM
jgi:membrane protease subunit (stomatin/prohibitin family)